MKISIERILEKAAEIEPKEDTEKIRKIRVIVDEMRADMKCTGKFSAHSFAMLRLFIKNGLFLDLLAVYREKGVFKNDAIILGRGLMQTVIPNPQEIINAIVGEKRVHTEMLLAAILAKNMKISCVPVVEYLKCVLGPESGTSQLGLCLFVAKNYPEYFDDELVSYCKNRKHAITESALEIYSKFN